MELFARSDTCRTMMSRQNSTSEISRGLSHVLWDAKSQSLPDNMEDLEDHHDVVLRMGKRLEGNYR